MNNWIHHFMDKLRFRQKLILTYLIISIIPILFLGTYSYHQSKRFLNEQAIKSFQRNVDVYSENIQSNMEHYETMASLVLYNNTIQRILANHYIDLNNLYIDLNNFLNPYLNMLLNLNKDTQQLTIYTRSKLPEYGYYINKIERITAENWYVALKKEKGIKWYHENNKLFLAGKFPYIFPSSNSNNSSLKVGDENILYIRVNNLNFFENMPDSTKGQWVFLVDTKGDPIYSNQVMDTKTAAMLSDIRNSTEGNTEINGTSMMLIKTKIPKTEWTLFCLVPSKNIVQNSGSIFKATLIVAGVCILFLVGIIAVFAQSMIKRIYMLNNWMKHAEDGDLELQVQSTSKDEIGELTNRFGNMLYRINELINEVYKNKIAQKEAELKALKSQIAPHFLYNTLSFINWKALKSQDLEISHMVTSLSKFYRTALNRGDNIISVRDEIENVKSYLDIILTTSGHRFDVIYRIDEDIYPYGMINLILQPIVENSVKHGINRKVEGRGVLEISAGIIGDSIEFNILDNGPGIEPQILVSLLTKPSGGYGLKNVDERIKLIFGTNYGIFIESNVNTGTCMRVTIPKHVL